MEEGGKKKKKKAEKEPDEEPRASSASATSLSSCNQDTLGVMSSYKLGVAGRCSVLTC